MKLLLTCEHGGNKIPLAYDSLFLSQELVLQTHRAYDKGALDLFKYLRPLAVFHKSNEISRLFIELNRSLHHPMLFSEFTKKLDKKEKQLLIQQYYLIYRDKVIQQIESLIHSKHCIFHISVHSFTPVFNGVTRKCDIGLLYDPSSIHEKKIAQLLKAELKKRAPELNIRCNYPYKGISDGFTKTLRKQFSKNYVGIEIEINQKFSFQNKINEDLKKVIYKSIKQIIEQQTNIENNKYKL
ncbi:putative N-formylglutamate amidohydrolase [Wenyingzhuangia heitensis]|uniref:N-formylglutamate amidohydrolase n=1 Tax=Wenyingzhuangia heitensis TaxID=1487859 RepID=A0ABX0UAU1_9FLAO|nr:N-formylglutamate amidohydrolase [Wenyingzhuangia heitensis]NIJ44576.1 putative N-formylglutamate amidohydrolase [Wenyingzhuangia heitensis]